MSQCSETDRGTDACGCCEGIARRTPSKIANAPGLPKIDYRIGRHPCFKQSMLAGLSDRRCPTLREGLNTRDDDDFAIALLDGAAVMADILTFYQERIANESYLRTATERSSVLQLARLVGYRLGPGVAASTHLAFMLEQPPALPAGMTPSPIAASDKVAIKAGTKAQSIPGQDEQAETFETVSDLVAEPQLDALRVVSEPVSAGGTGSGLSLAQATSVFSALAQTPVASGRASGQASETVSNATLQEDLRYLEPLLAGGALAGRDRALLSGDVSGLAQGDHLVVFSGSSGQTEDKTLKSLKTAGPVTEIVWEPALQQELPADFQVRKWTRKYKLFGYNLTGSTSGGGDSFVSVTTDGLYSYGSLPLDGLYDDFRAGQEILVQTPGSMLPATVMEVTQRLAIINAPTTVELAVMLAAGVAIPVFSATVTWLTLKWTPPVDLSDLTHIPGGVLRSASIHLLAGAQTSRWRYHATSVPTGNKVWIPSCKTPVAIGRQIAFTDDSDAAQVVRVTKCTAEGTTGLTRIEFEPALTRPLDTMSAVMLGNVAPATHGETTSEVLGSGDASQAYQEFTLRQPPLTYVGAAGAGGAKSTLEVRVDDRLWNEVPTLYGRGPGEHVYVTRTENDGRTVVQFGDGKTGARLPTGRENVRARYRKGIGVGGMARAGQVSLLTTRPLGVKSVVNPLRATDAADPESMENARRTAPLKALTLDRAVSLQDYEDFAQAFAGIAKALATWTWNGEQRGVFITVAGPNGTEPSAEPCRKLVTALHQSGDPYVLVTVKPCRSAGFTLHASLKVEADRVGEEKEVLAAAREAIVAAFSFEARNIGQAVTLSEVMAVLQAVPGVQAANVANLVRPDQMALTESWVLSEALTVLQSLDRSQAVSADESGRLTWAERVEPLLIAAFPRMGERGAVTAAELLRITPESLILEVMA